MALDITKLTPAGQGNMQQVTEGKKVFAAFEQMAENPQQVNDNLLFAILEENKDTEYGKKYGFADIHTVEEYQKKVPVSVYDDYAGYILKMSEEGAENLITSGKIVHYNKSSGTVGNPKKIPLTEKSYEVLKKYNGPYRFGLLASELGEESWIDGRCISVAESTSEQHYVKSGVSYGALSVKMIAEYRPYLEMVFTSPDEAIFPDSETNTRYLHIRYGLMDKNITNISGTFLGYMLEILHYMEQNWKLLVKDIAEGTIDPSIKMPDEVRKNLEEKLQPMPERAAELKEIFEQGFEEPIVPKLWPNMHFMTGVGSGGFKVYADKIHERYMGEGVARYFLGISASEGSISVPYRLNDEKSVPLPDALFYEFLPVDAEDDFTKCVTMDKVEIGKEYEIIITNMSGFYRYRMRDSVRITGRHKGLPIMEFLCRMDQTVSIMGEKTTEVALRTAAEDTAKELGFNMIDFSVYPDVNFVPPRYVYFMEIDELPAGLKAKEIRFVLEHNLAKANPSMGDKVKKGICAPTKLNILEPDTYNLYRDLMVMKGTVSAQLKPVRVIRNEIQRKFFFSQTEYGVEHVK